jgi:hypothetical protein
VAVDLLDGVGSEVREAAVLEVAPEQLDGIEFWRVGREADDVKAPMGGQPRPHEVVLVGAAAVPEQNDGPAHVPGKVAKKPEHLRPRMLIRGNSAKARVSWRRRGDTTKAPMPDTFSWERARTASVGVTPHGAHVRRRTGIIRKPVSSSAIRWAPSRRSFFYLRPLPLTPLANPTVVAFFGARLGTLRAEAAGAQQSADVVGMVDDIKAGADHFDDPSTGPQIRAIARGFRSGHDQAR